MARWETSCKVTLAEEITRLRWMLEVMEKNPPVDGIHTRSTSFASVSTSWRSWLWFAKTPSRVTRQGQSLS